ncbi:MAG: hypothetical protein EBZ58_06345, partial [Bacteroidetes bacterium]|nr:hypothetical protein [Bacteroidota bacterium]
MRTNNAFSLTINKILFLTICLILFKSHFVCAQDEKTYYAKKEIIVYKDKETNKVVNEIVMAKNIAIEYDETFKKISLYFISEDGSNGKIRLTFIQYSRSAITNEIRKHEMIMIDKSNNKYYVQFDPIECKCLYLYPYNNPTVNGMT